jgi:hypothetical protein
MTSNDSRNSAPGSDDVAAAYRKANFDEGPPPAVDQAILAAARQEQRKPFPAYLPPLALAATVVLSVSLVLRSGMLNETSEVFPEPAMAPAADTPSSTVLDRDVNLPREEIRALNEEAAFSDAAAEANEALESGGGSEAFEAAPAAADLRTVAPQPELDAELPSAPQALEFESAAELSTSTVAGDGCSESDRQQAESWIECITSLRANGNENAARSELEVFLDVYPSITVPANLSESLAP